MDVEKPVVSGLAKTAKEAEEVATQILGMEIKGLPVRKVLVDPAANIEQEIYLGLPMIALRADQFSWPQQPAG